MVSQVFVHSDYFLDLLNKQYFHEFLKTYLKSHNQTITRRGFGIVLKLLTFDTDVSCHCVAFN